MVTTILIIVHLTELIIVCSIIFLQVNDVFLCHTILINCAMFQEASEPGKFPGRGEDFLLQFPQLIVSCNTFP